MIKGSKMTLESRIKMKEAKLSNPTRYWLGKKRSKITCKKISIANKGRLTWNKGKKGLQHHTEEWKRKRSIIQKGKSFKKKIIQEGYIFILNWNHPFHSKKGYIREHRLIVEKQIGRYLLPSEKTHHRGKKDDNRPHMLMAFTCESAHQRFHKDSNNVKPEEIIFDGRHLASKTRTSQVPLATTP